ncbi:MAG: DUF4392 domain-containing protein, partial [Chloroflexi bacterium]|nr:DUF4392 domain-containing protein [Chloroflexota bacterium]
CDPGGRNIFALVAADQLRLAAQSLRLARRVGIVSGFYIPEAGAGETDGPPGAGILGQALGQLGITVDYLTDEWNAPLFRTLGIEPIVDAARYLDEANPTHLVAVERAGRGRDGRYRNLRGVDITATTAPLDELFLDASRRGVTTIGIGDGGNEIGMGRFNRQIKSLPDLPDDPAVTPTRKTIISSVSNWGAYGLITALSRLSQRDLLPSVEWARELLTELVARGAVDGISGEAKCTVDGFSTEQNAGVLAQLKHLLQSDTISTAA